MANVQKENGYIPIATELADKLCSFKLSTDEYRIIWVIWRKTWGWKKKKDRISISQFSALTGMKQSNVCRTIKRLLYRKVVICSDNNNCKTYGFNKDFDKWIELSKQIVLSKQITKVIQTDNKSLSVQADTIDTTITTHNNSPLPAEQSILAEYFVYLWNKDHAMPYPKPAKHDYISIANLLKQYKITDISHLIGLYFQSNNEFINKTGKTIQLFIKSIPQLIRDKETRFIQI